MSRQSPGRVNPSHDHQGKEMSEGVKPAAGRAGMLSLAIKEKTALFAAYMPHIKGGGLFIPTNRPYQMGDQVYMLLTLMDEANKLPISGRVVWITPAGSQGNRQQGIGVQFDDTESATAVRLKIEGILGNAMKSTRQTHTI
jgi:type IV pilus assembly protein PilZ